MIHTSETGLGEFVTDELTTALDSFQRRAVHVPKNAVNPFFSSRYADLFSIKQICDPVLVDCGLMITQFLGGGESGTPTLITRLIHVGSGQFMEAETPLMLPKSDPQAHGSAITYMRRYSYCAILGIVADPDDDGNAASQPAQRPVANQPEYQEVNGEQIPTGYTEDPIVRTGPGGVSATPVSEKQGKMLYAITKSTYGDEANVAEVISRLIGRQVKRTDEVWASEMDALVPKLKAHA